MELTHNSKLDSSEIFSLWTTFMELSMSSCIIKYFSSLNEDVNATSLFDLSLQYSEQVKNNILETFNKESFPIPFAFTDDDIQKAAPRLYSDIFALRYIQYMAGIGMTTYSTSQAMAARADIRTLFSTANTYFSEVYNKVTDYLLEKGMFVRPSTIPIPEKAEYVKKDSFLSGLFGKHRPLTVIELAHISKNSESNSLGRSLLLGFSQVAKSKTVREYMARGKEIAEKHDNVFRQILEADDIPSPTTWDSTITESIAPTFSDKLMMFQVSSLNSTSISNYGAGLATSMRTDLGANFIRLMTEVMDYAKDGAKIMIENGWFEQPPQLPDRNALARV